MLLELKLARAFLFARRKSLARFTASVAVVSLAVGVASLLLAQAIAAGFSSEMQSKLLANTPHISVFMKDGSRISESNEVIDKITGQPGVVSVTPSAYESAVLFGETSAEYAVIRTDHGLPAPASDGHISVLLGDELAARSGVAAGDAVRMMIFGDEGTHETNVSVVGTFRTGLFEYDSTWVKIAPLALARLRGEPTFTPGVLNVSVTDPFRSGEAAASIRNRLGDQFRVIDWQEANGPLFAALSAERRAATAVILLMVAIAAVNITTTLALVAGERRADVAVLRTCGISGRQVAAIFVLQGLILGAAGVAAGTLLGLGAAAAGNYFEILRLPAGVYSLGYIPLRLDTTAVLFTAFAALAVALLAAAFPAWRAKREKPLELLRTQ